MFKIVRGMELTDSQEEAFNDFCKLLRYEWSNDPRFRNCSLDLVTGRCVGDKMVVHITGTLGGTQFQIDTRNPDPAAACRFVTWFLKAAVENFKVDEPPF